MAAAGFRSLVALAIGSGLLAVGCTCGGPSKSSRNIGPQMRLTVGPSGGTLASADGTLTVTVPAGALSAPVDLTIQQIVNSAPAGQGPAYELGPAGQAFAAPVLLAFRNTTALPNEQLWLSYLINQTSQNQGLWIHAASVVVDGTANTLTTAVSDFGWTDWSLVGTGPNVGKDLAGSFALVSTLEVPFTATTTQLMLAYAGEDARATYYFPVGPLTIQSPVTLGSATCSPITPPGASVQVASNAVVELRKGADPIPLLLAIDAHWGLSCSNGTSALADTRFDTLGISLGTCTRSYVGTPTLAAAGIRCDAGNGCFYLIDCGARGQERATFNFTPCTPGVACASSNACHTAAISCTTGFPVCTDNGNVADGTSCGTNQVCGGGVCNACAAGQPCASGNPCHTAALVCSSGYPVCTDNGNQPNGTSCGTNQVCTAGACTACTQGAACTPTNPCHNGVQDCAQGYACVDAGTNVADGAGCGTNLVCGGGVCNACTPGQACASGNPCHTAALVCTSGYPVCTDDGSQPNGTSCGANQVCTAGACTACTQGAACTPTNPCHNGVQDCAQGYACVDAGTNVTDGASCGTNLVCGGGTCNACTPGQPCTSGNPCHTAALVCSSGFPVCTDNGNVADGTSCGTNLVCGGGACNTCTQGQPCTSGDPCHTAALVCSSGFPVCTDNGNQANGTSCGTNQVCTSGACTACTQGAPCAPANPCHNGAQDCVQGYACVDAGTNVANGTGCGAGQTCNAGACVPSRTVAGARLVTQWPDPGPDVPVPAPEVAAVPPAAPVAVSALVPDGAGGWINYPGSFPSPGSFSIAAVPVGSYLLDYVDGGGAHILVDTSASSIDLGYDAPGRSGAVKASGPTPVTFSLSGLDPWNAGGDRIEITSSNADAWDFLPSSGLAPGATGGDLVEDWFAAQADGAPLDLLAPADLLYLHQLATATDASSLNAYQYASHWTSLTGATLSDQMAASLSPPPFQAIAPLGGSLPGATWSLSQFDQLASMNPTATTDASAHSLVVGASPFPLAAPGPVARAAPLLLAMRLPRGTTPDPAVGSLPYGQFLDARWQEWRGAAFTVHVSYAASGGTALDQIASIGSRQAMPPPAGPIAPDLTPVQSPLVNGASAFATITGVGPTPAISWTAPATGLPTRYALEVYWLHAIAGSSVATRVATWVTSALAVSLPPGVLQPGSTYFARITAYAIPGDPYAAATPAPLRQPALYGHASVLTGTFSP